jgi:hypothetical protein
MIPYAAISAPRAFIGIAVTIPSQAGPTAHDALAKEFTRFAQDVRPLPVERSELPLAPISWTSG